MDNVLCFFICTFKFGFVTLVTGEKTFSTKGAVASPKVLVELFQKLAGIQGTASLVDARKHRNIQDFRKSSFFASFFLAKGKKKSYITAINNNGVLQMASFNVNATRPVITFTM